MHGDDFSALGLEDDLAWYEEEFCKHVEIGYKTKMNTEPGFAKEVRILNRILRLQPNGLRYEADPRHIELLAKIFESGRLCVAGYPADVKHGNPNDLDDDDAYPSPDVPDNGVPVQALTCDSLETWLPTSQPRALRKQDRSENLI